MSEKQTMTRLRWFWAWQDDKEERWLEAMARQGWHLMRGGILFQFERGEPREMRYRLDYRRGTRGALQDYFALCQDAGWEYVGDFAGWRYFRSPVAAGAPDLYTDGVSRAGKYRRLLTLLIVLVVVQGVNLGSLLSATGRAGRSSGWAVVVTAALLALLGYALYRVKRRIAQECRAGGPGQCS